MNKRQVGRVAVLCCAAFAVSAAPAVADTTTTATLTLTITPNSTTFTAPNYDNGVTFSECVTNNAATGQTVRITSRVYDSVNGLSYNVTHFATIDAGATSCDNALTGNGQTSGPNAVDKVQLSTFVPA